MIFSMIIYQVDAFTNKIFKGNPAAVCPLKEWISERIMQAIAEENNLSETVFFVQREDRFDIRWFTPTSDIYSVMNYDRNLIEFNSKSGKLTLEKKGDWYTLNFPSEQITEIEKPSFLESALNAPVIKTYKGKWKYLVELENEAMVKNLAPNFGLLSNLESNGIIVTAEGTEVDFVSRFFAPKLGINEDPVTGSAHTLLIPHWADKLKKPKMEAIQLSKRTGFLKCEFLDERVEMSGQAVTYLKGTISVNIGGSSGN
jgi:predicted PhzF superfamily epimerase YddE/YHI9